MTKIIVTTIVVCVLLFLWQAYIQHRIEKGDLKSQKLIWWIGYFIQVIAVIIPLVVSLYDPMSTPNLKFEYDYNYFKNGIEREDLYQVIPKKIYVDAEGNFYHAGELVASDDDDSWDPDESYYYYHAANTWIGFAQDHRFINGHYNTIYDTSLTTSVHLLIMDGDELLASIPVEANDDFIIRKNYDNSTGTLEFTQRPKIMGTMKELLKEVFTVEHCPYEISESIIVKFHYKQTVDDKAYVLSTRLGKEYEYSLTDDEIYDKRISGVVFTKEMYDSFVNSIQVEDDFYVTEFYYPYEECIEKIYDAIGFEKES